MPKLIIFLLLPLCMTSKLTSQETTRIPSEEKERTQGAWYNTLGFNFDEHTLQDNEIKINTLFQKLVKLNAPFSDISLPVIGEFHFRDYDFVDSKTGPFRYNYFLGTADLTPSLYLFGSKSHKANIRFSLGVNVRVWNKRRKPLRSVFEWEASNAVKTPSYRPGIFYSRLIKAHTTATREKLNYIEVGFTHHSNGQDAPTLTSQDSTLLLSASQKYNINDGDFSTNYITLAFHNVNRTGTRTIFHSWQLVFDGIGTYRVEHEDLLKYKAAYTCKYILYNNEESVKNDKMGQHNFELTIGMGLVDFTQFDLKQSLSYAVSYRYKMPWTDKIAFLFSYGYMGQDNYNIFLQNRMHYFRWGLSSLIN